MDHQSTDLSSQEFERLVLEEYDYTRPRRGVVYEATIVDIGENDIVVDMGVKRDGIIPSQDLRMVDPDYRANLRVGDRIPVAVARPQPDMDGINVSLSRGLEREDWLRAQACQESSEIVDCEVMELNRGGLLAAFGNVHGFVPNSHLSSSLLGLREGRLESAKEDLMGKTISLVVIEVNQQRRRLVMSQRVADRLRRGNVLEELEEGQIRSGIVRNLVAFGAFVDIGGIDGLIHVSELDWRRVEHPSEVLSVGENVQVLVLSVDRDRQRIGLSRRRLLPDPWEQVAASLEIDSVIDGTVTHTVTFGAFIDVGHGIEGLAHVSQMPAQSDTLSSLTSGMAVRVRVLDINDIKHQIALSLEEPEPRQEMDEIDYEEGPEEVEDDYSETDEAAVY